MCLISHAVSNGSLSHLDKVSLLTCPLVGSEKGEGKAVGLEREEEASCSTLRCWNFILEVSRSAAQGPTIRRLFYMMSRNVP